MWFKEQPMGENKINDMMKSIVTIVSDAILDTRDKEFTTHRARKTVLSKLKKAHVERSGTTIIVTRHKNIQSLDDYDEENED